MSNFKPFLQNIEPFLEKYDLVLRLSKAENGSIRLVVSPVGKNPSDPVHTPIAYRGSLDEVAAKLEDPTKGLEEIGQQAHNISIRWEKEAEDADTKKGKSPARKTAAKKAAPTKTAAQPEPPRPETPKQTDLLEEAEKAEKAQAEEAAKKPDPAPSFLEEEGPKAEPVDPKVAKYDELFQAVTGELRALMGPDWADVDKNWKLLLAHYKEQLNAEQQAARKEAMNELRNEMVAKYKAAQESIKSPV